MSKLNLEDVLFMCLGMEDSVESRIDPLDRDILREPVVLVDRTDGLESGSGEVSIVTAVDLVEDEACIDAAGPSLGGTGGTGWSGRGFDTSYEAAFDICDSAPRLVSGSCCRGGS